MRWLTSNLDFLQARSAAELTLAFAMGTFQTCVFVFVPLFYLFLTGDLGDQLEDLSTLLGIALFGLLWLTTYVCTIGAWADIGVDGLRVDSAGRMLLYGFKWGALDGVAFLLLLVFAGVMALGAWTLAEGQPATLLGVWVFGILVAVIGGAFAAVIGGFFGMAAAVIELPLVYASRAIAGGTARQPRR